MISPLEFVKEFEKEKPVFAKEIRRTYENHTELFNELAAHLLEWAFAALGDEFVQKLIEGYCLFVVDVNRSQKFYESTGRYLNNSYEDVFNVTYNSPDFMNLYHWGVFTTTFAWQHHLEIYKFYRDNFLNILLKSDAGTIIDLGCGSGVWHFLALRRLPGWSTTAVDISETSISLSQKMAIKVIPSRNINYVIADAITWNAQQNFDVGISFFLLEHLENPSLLMNNFCRLIKPGGFGFLTCALTAAEIDHIYEFKRESEVVILAENAGFRVIKAFSSAPDSIPHNRRYLPRSLCLVLQRRKNDIW